jgi:RHS repeat-associated protein
MTRRSLQLIVLAGVSLLWPARAAAFHAPPWDTGHQSFRPDPGDGTDPGDNDCNNSGSPFEIATGNFIHSVTDLSIRSLGPALDVTRTYNSRDMRSGPFGHGWSFVYDQRLIEVTDGLVTHAICRGGDGKRERFTRAADGSYAAPEDVFALLTRGADGFTLTEKTGSFRRFDTDGRLTAVSDRNGNAVNLSYDATGFMLAMRDAGGRSLQLSKGANGKVSSISDSFGRSVRYEYDSAGNLVRFVNPLEQSTEYAYDATHNLIRVVDPRGNLVQRATYNAADRVTSYTEGQRLWTITYQADRTVKRDSSNQAWTFFFNPNGNVTRVLDPVGGDERFTYDSQFNVVAHQDPNGNVTQYTYDPAGNVTSMTDPLGNITRMTYESGFNQVESVTDPLGHTTRFRYDDNGNLRELVDAAGNTTTMAYDARGQLTRITDPLGNAVGIEFDAQGILNATTDALGSVTRSTFDEAGRLTAQTNAEGRTTRYEYDAVNRLLSITDALGQLTRFGYDAAGNLISVLDANDHTTTYEYDEFNRLVRKVDPAGRAEAYAYDSQNRLIRLTTAANQVITLGYDGAGRRTLRQTADDTVRYTYDRRGNLTQVSDSDSNLSYQYDTLNRIAQARTTATVSQPATTITYSYDADSNLISMTSSFGGATAYAYDPLHRLIRVTEPGGALTSYTYDQSSRRTRVDMPNGVVSQSEFDAANRLRRLVHTQGAQEPLQFEYSYDRVGNRVGLHDLSGAHTYSYDALDRLSQAAQPVEPFAERYAYDAVGNRLSSHLSPVYRYDEADRLLEDERFLYSYDANGNQIERRAKAAGPTIQFAYDTFNAVVRRTGTAGESTTYRYDGLGRRIEKNVNGAITRYLYDGGDIVAELNGTNQVVATFAHGPGIDDPIVRRQSTAAHFYLQDGLGSIAAVADATGAIGGAFTYDSFGRVVRSTVPTASGPYSYTGRELDGESGLLFYRARYYDPEIGRFLSRDPVPFVEGGDINAYAYVRNNPVNVVDPTGELAWFVAPIIGGLIGGGIDLAWQLIQNGGNLGCVDWGDVALSAGLGAGFSMLGPSGPIFGRAGSKAAQLGYKGGILNTGNTRIGWSWHQGRNWFGVHGGKPYTPGHWHATPIPGPSGPGVVGFGVGGGVAGGAAGAGIGGGAECQCQ